jgi:hypothetical protein
MEPPRAGGGRGRSSPGPGVPPLVRLKAICGLGDDAAPVVTIMLPDED